ncbi:lipid-binding SYLF domain-containing protein [Variovorax sp. YR216]|uniref:lipid-binding SYLF domain-containing protein n=1 Tax=Variovorax sp. YR216 TaxID=1882828 RepID=UPI000895AC0F|nr:lipid-binding SYLF domain-containing protein [Variovorax sp. YR216]SEB19148.1 Lipid-binding SYLF domain-containing protein [Variovorax sp. YR216]
MQNTRRKLMLAFGALGLTAGFATMPAHASDAEDAKALVHKAQTTINAFTHNKDFSGLGAELGKAKGVLIFPKVLKAGFVLGGSGGTGVLLANDGKGGWVGPAFYTMGSASFGFQAGASAAEVVILVRTQKALDSLLTSKVKLGGDASVAVWKKGMGAGGTIDADFVGYSAVKGAFAGLAIDGSVLDVRESLNTAFYGKPVTPSDILVKREVSNPAAAGLLAAVSKVAK